MSANAPSTGHAEHGHDAHGGHDKTSPEAHAHPNAPSTVHEGAQNAASDNIRKLEFGFRHRTEKAMGHLDRFIPRFDQLKPLPPPPSIKTLAKAGATVATVAAPPLAITAGATGYVAYKGWNILKKYPIFSHIDRGVRSAGNMAIDGLKSVGEIASYPFRLTGTLAKNTIGAVSRVGMETVLKPVVDFGVETTAIINQKLGLPANTQLPAALAAATKSGIGKVWNMGANAVKFAVEHPVVTVGGTFLTLGILNGANWDLGVAGSNVLNAAAKLVEWVAARFPGK